MSKSIKWLIGGVCAIVVGVVLRITGVAGTLLSPLQEAVTTGTTAVYHWLDFGNYRQKYQQAQTELTTLRQQIIEQEQAVHDARWYREFLGLKEANPALALCEAQVIAVDANTFTVNRGTLDGIDGGEPVITSDGLVGVVKEAGLSWARVFTLAHKDVVVSVVSSRNREKGEVIGGVARFSRDSTVQEGERLITSGYGGTYPRGLMMGELRSCTLQSDGLYRSAAVKMYAEYQERVMVITAF